MANRYDESYKASRGNYYDTLEELKEAFIRLRATHNLKKVIGTDNWKKRKETSSFIFNRAYDKAVMVYNNTQKYWNENHTKMVEYVDWNNTLLHPDEWLLVWETKL